MWIHRTIKPELLGLAKLHPLVALLGLRQTGKTSLLQRNFSKAVYFSLDEPGIQEVAIQDPQSLIDSGSQIIFDEIQNAPELPSFIKLGSFS